MSPLFVIVLVGLLYVAVIGGMALLRREGLSIRFAVESICITAVAGLVVALTNVQIHPVLFFIVLYLLTMRIRLLADLANVFAKRGNLSPAARLYKFAWRLWPDASGRLILMVNQATLLLQENQLDESISMFMDVLSQSRHGYLGAKYEAAAHYNLGVACLRKNNPARATVEFNAAIDTWPASLYAHRAQEALDRQQSRVRDTGDRDRPEG
jgi:tetratricopeptide (TPR) repeat protein